MFAWCNMCAEMLDGNNGWVEEEWARVVPRRATSE